MHVKKREEYIWRLSLANSIFEKISSFLPSSNIRFLTTVWFSEDKNLKDFRYYLRKGTCKFPSHSSQRLLQGLFIKCTSISKRGSVCVWIFSLTPLASVFIKTRFSSNVSPMQRGLLGIVSLAHNIARNSICISKFFLLHTYIALWVSPFLKQCTSLDS